MTGKILLAAATGLAAMVLSTSLAGQTSPQINQENIAQVLPIPSSNTVQRFIELAKGLEGKLNQGSRGLSIGDSIIYSWFNPVDININFKGKDFFYSLVWKDNYFGFNYENYNMPPQTPTFFGMAPVGVQHRYYADVGSGMLREYDSDYIYPPIDTKNGAITLDKSASILPYSEQLKEFQGQFEEELTRFTETFKETINQYVS